MDTDMPDIQSADKGLLRYHEKLDGFRDTVEKYYSERTISVYRTVRTNPPTDDDLIPQRYFPNEEGLVEEIIIYSAEDIEEMTDAEKKEEVGGDALSVNNTPEQCVKSALGNYRTIIERHPERAERFKSMRGPYVARLAITPAVGVITKSHSGHRNLLIREGVGIKDIWDTGYDLMSFDYDAEQDKRNE